MKNFSLILCFIVISQALSSQTPAQNPTNCQTGISIQISSSGATYVVLSNAAPFLFVPSAGQLTFYELTEVGTSSPFAQQTVTQVPGSGNPNNAFNFQLPPSVTTADRIEVEMTVTNTNGHVCFVKDTLQWTPVGTPPFQFFFWRNLVPQNFGTFSTLPPLPIEWVSFSGESKKGDVHLKWSIATEVNNEGYEVQVSTDVKSWETIGFVEGRGTTESKSDYSFVHRDAPKARLYYRLIQVDYDGKTSMSKMIALNNAQKGQGLGDMRVYPNPSNGKTTIDFGSTPIGSFTMNIYNNIGQLVKSMNQNDISDAILPLDLNQPGLYFVQLNRDGQQQTQYLIVE